MSDLILSQTNVTTDIDVTQLEITKSGLFSFQGRPVTIYLKESGKRASTLRKNVEQSAKFHVVPCPTIGDPRSSKRSQRYVATTRMDGFFPLWGATPTGEVEEVEVKLQVCRACLIKLDYKNYNTHDAEMQDQLANHFSIEELFRQYADVVVENIETTAIATVTQVAESLTPASDIVESIAVTNSDMIAEAIVVASPLPTPLVVETHFSEPQPAPCLSEPTIVTQKESTAKKEEPVAEVEFTILTNLYVLQILLKRLTKFFF